MSEIEEEMSMKNSSMTVRSDNVQHILFQAGPIHQYSGLHSHAVQYPSKPVGQTHSLHVVDFFFLCVQHSI